MEPSQAPPFQGLSQEEYAELKTLIDTYHKFEPSPNTCTSLITQRIDAPAQVVWPFIRSFENPQKYKHFIKSCNMRGTGGIGSIREVTVVSGLPASTSTERLEILDDEKHILSFRVVGVDIPEGNTGEDTKMFVDTVIKLNLQKLAVVAMASLHGHE
ncbi:hypothetical protein GH714_027377 [Hevea brasiliensis]|uniref:Uncharacterized protein n=1 Tax=Hevea brasiliensis TaxID=3981 RepID=A0A6A6LV40_HEVBR|nr:hypothetical protein GH714_027377 [Hevea brasiliensis]